MTRSYPPGRPGPRAGMMGLLMALCLVLLLTSCRGHLWQACSGTDSGPGSQMSLSRVGSLLAGPFRTVDHKTFAVRSMTGALVEGRVQPATVATGKKFLTLEECRALALRNNLDLQVARLNEITKAAVVYSTKTKMLPTILCSGELAERGNYGYSFSDVMGQEGRTPTPGVGGTGVTSFSVGHERSTWRYVLETRWTPTDAAWPTISRRAIPTSSSGPITRRCE